MADIQSLLDDVSHTVTVGKLDGVFEYSQSDYVDKLKSSASDLMEINNIVNDLLVQSKSMLYYAKKIYQDTDLSGKSSIENYDIDS